MARFYMGVLVVAAVAVASLEATMPAEAEQGSSMLSVRMTLSSGTAREESSADAAKRARIVEQLMGGERMKLLDDFESTMRDNNLKMKEQGSVAVADDALPETHNEDHAEPKDEANAEPKAEEQPAASPEIHDTRFEELFGSSDPGNEAGPAVPAAQAEDSADLPVEPAAPVEPSAEEEPPTGDETGDAADAPTGDTADDAPAPEEDGLSPDDADAMSASSMLATKTTVSSGSGRMKLLEDFEASIREDNQKLLESGSVAVAKTSVPKDSAQHEDPADASTEADEESSDDDDEEESSEDEEESSESNDDLVGSSMLATNAVRTKTVRDRSMMSSIWSFFSSLFGWTEEAEVTKDDGPVVVEDTKPIMPEEKTQDVYVEQKPAVVKTHQDDVKGATVQSKKEQKKQKQTNREKRRDHAQETSKKAKEAKEESLKREMKAKKEEIKELKEKHELKVNRLDAKFKRAQEAYSQSTEKLAEQQAKLAEQKNALAEAKAKVKAAEDKMAEAKIPEQARKEDARVKQDEAMAEDAAVKRETEEANRKSMELQQMRLHNVEMRTEKEESAKALLWMAPRMQLLDDFEKEIQAQNEERNQDFKEFVDNA